MFFWNVWEFLRKKYIVLIIERIHFFAVVIYRLIFSAVQFLVCKKSHYLVPLQRWRWQTACENVGRRSLWKMTAKCFLLKSCGHFVIAMQCWSCSHMTWICPQKQNSAATDTAVSFAQRYANNVVYFSVMFHLIYVNIY